MATTLTGYGGTFTAEAGQCPRGAGLMHTEGDALFREVLERPQDDTVRLIHADWLEDAGRVQFASYIRAACASRITSRWDWDGAAVRYLHPRGSFAAPEWLATGWGRPPLSGTYHARRGWPCSAEVDWRHFVRHAREPFLWAPLTAVRLAGFDEPEYLGGRQRYWWREGTLPALSLACRGWVPDSAASTLRAMLDALEPRMWPQARGAIRALSDVLVRWGRGLAGLPPLGRKGDH